MLWFLTNGSTGQYPQEIVNELSTEADTVKILRTPIGNQSILGVHTQMVFYKNGSPIASL